MRAVFQEAAANNILEVKIPTTEFCTASINHKLSETYKNAKNDFYTKTKYSGMRANGFDDLKNNTGDPFLANRYESIEKHKIV